MENSEWIQIKSKKKTKGTFVTASTNHKQGSHPPKCLQSCHLDISHNSVELESILEQIDVISRFFLHNKFDSIVNKCLVAQQKNYMNIVALGIGNFSTSYSSMIQFCIALTMYKYAAYPNSVAYASPQPNDERVISLSMYDPLFTELELKVCHHFGIDILSNQHGFYDASNLGRNDNNDIKVVVSDLSFVTTPSEPSEPSETSETTEAGESREIPCTLFFMPHCPLQLYSNVLFANWSHLDAIIILGNRYILRSDISSVGGLIF